MKVILLEDDEAYQKLMYDIKSLIKDVIKEIKTEKDNEWVSTDEAKRILGVKSKSKMQDLRDKNLIKYSKHGKIIQYYKPSLSSFLEKHVPRY